MNKLLASASFAAMALIASQSLADPYWPRWYVGLSGGVTFLDDTDVSGAATGNTEFDTGWNGAASLGYVLPVGMQPFSNMRVEAELGYHSTDIDSVTLGGTTTASAGTVRIASYMANVYYDFRNASGVTPYLGAGAGGARVKLSRNSGLSNVDEKDNVFAYQLMLGLSYAPTSMPMTEWSLGYRYFTAREPSFATNVQLDDITAHSAEIGARFKF